MKNYFIVCASLLLISASLFAESNVILVEGRIQQGDKLQNIPRVTTESGKSFGVRIVQEFIVPPDMPMECGLLVDGKTTFKNGKIVYAITVTTREHDAGVKPTAEQHVAAFQSHEYLMSGESLPGQEVKVELGNQTFVYLKFSSVKPAKSNG